MPETQEGFPETKDGFKLCATVRKAGIALYRKGDVWRILDTDKNTFTEEAPGTRQYPPAPSGRWYWEKGPGLHPLHPEGVPTHGTNGRAASPKAATAKKATPKKAAAKKSTGKKASKNPAAKKAGGSAKKQTSKAA